MRFEFSQSDVVDLYYLVRFAHSKVPKGAAYKQVRFVLNGQLQNIIHKILFYAKESLFMVQVNNLELIWKKITGEEYAY